MPEPSTLDGLTLPGTVPSTPYENVPEKVMPFPPEVPVYSPELSTVTPGEGWYDVFEGLGVAAEQRSALLEKIGPELAEMRYNQGMSVAYFEDFGKESGGEWRVNMPADKKMPREALDLITLKTRLAGMLSE
jgi:hypothetical protein